MILLPKPAILAPGGQERTLSLGVAAGSSPYIVKQAEGLTVPFTARVAFAGPGPVGRVEWSLSRNGR